MTRSDWAGLPAQVRQAVTEHLGAVSGFEPIATGAHSEIAGTLDTSSGRVFVKGCRVDGPEARSLRYEARVTPVMARLAPRFLAVVETGGWVILCSEHIQGRHADFSPGSPDLDQVAKLILELQGMACPPEVTRRVIRRWEPMTDTSQMDGATLLHCDINPGNILFCGDRPVLVDWAFSSCGAAWVELAILVQWLISAGHTPAQAEAWVSQFPCWHSAEPEAVNRLADTNAALWRQRAATTGLGWAAEIADWTQQWAAHRSL